MSLAYPGDDIRCDWCDRPGEPFEYKGHTFSGLCPCEGDKLCLVCVVEYLYQKSRAHGVNVIYGELREFMGLPTPYSGARKLELAKAASRQPKG